jgi:hypothetical protein
MTICVNVRELQTRATAFASTEPRIITFAGGVTFHEKEGIAMIWGVMAIAAACGMQRRSQWFVPPIIAVAFTAAHVALANSWWEEIGDAWQPAVVRIFLLYLITGLAIYGLARFARRLFRAGETSKP